MEHVLQLAIGTAQRDVDHRPLLWALLSALEQRDLHTQVFLSRSHFVCSNAAIVVTGQDYRHLDSWLMAPDLCRQLFAFGSRSCDAAVVEGSFAAQADARANPPGGDLDVLCQWIGLAKLAIVDVQRVRCCCLPEIPAGATAILLDNVTDEQDARQQQTAIEALLGVPVVGWLPCLPQIRDAVAQLSPGTRPGAEMCHFLGEQLLSRLDLGRLCQLTGRPRSSLAGVLPQARRRRPLTVAVAYDDAFQCYFQDSFDMLEALGATLLDFSPLRGDMLPCDADIVYFGCGPVAHYASELARNCCMREAIRRYVRRGGRVYAECGGLAYLGKQLELPGGDKHPMAGILPIAVKLADTFQEFEPVALTLREPCWIGRPSQVLRGYLNPNWQVSPLGQASPLGAVRRYGSTIGAPHALLGYEQVVGSQVHLNFAAQADFLQRFFVPPVNDFVARHQ